MVNSAGSFLQRSVRSQIWPVAGLGGSSTRVSMIKPPAARMGPLACTLPLTSSLKLGLAVPMPTLPLTSSWSGED